MSKLSFNHERFLLQPEKLSSGRIL